METPRIPHRNAPNTLTVVTAVLLGFLVLDRIAAPSGTGSFGPSQASAQVRSVKSGTPAAGPEEEPSDSRISAADQRKQMIAELRAISQRLDRVEAVLSKGIQVKVTDMPEMKLPKSLEARLNERSGN